MSVFRQRSHICLSLVFVLSALACGDDETGSSGGTSTLDAGSGDLAVEFDVDNSDGSSQGDGGTGDGGVTDGSLDDGGGSDAVGDGSAGDDAGGDADPDGGTIGDDAGGEDATGDGTIGDDAGGDDVGGDASDDVAIDLGPTGDECDVPNDCQNTFGDPACGAWECNNGYCDVVCADCTDIDLDGFGSGNGCAGPDCNDDDDTVFDNIVTDCYDQQPSHLTAPNTVCRAGTLTCIDGNWGQCVGLITPTAEACNGVNDDCDSETDEGLGQFQCGLGACVNTVDACDAAAIGQCLPLNNSSSDSNCDGVDNNCDGTIDEGCSACVYVRIDGRRDGGDPAGSITNPYSVIQDGIDHAVDNPDGPQRVCVAAGDGCGYERYLDSDGNTEIIEMANGVDVIGNYRLNFSSRCDFQFDDDDGRAVFSGIESASFDDISEQTQLDGFHIERATDGVGTGVIVKSSVAYLANLDIPRDNNNDETIGVAVIEESDVFLTGSSIHGGNGSNVSIGVLVEDSVIEIRDVCDDYNDQGQCNVFCGQNTVRSIRGRHDSGDCEGGRSDCPDSYGVVLDNAPGSVIDRTAICGNWGAEGATVLITGDAEDIVIRGSLINAWGGYDDSHGIWMTECENTAPWIVDNYRIATGGEEDFTLADGVRAEGECHPVIDGNLFITGGGEGGTSDANGVHCMADGDGNPSRCIVINNERIQGAEGGNPPRSTGVRCDDGSCVRVAGNEITAHGGEETYGVWLFNTGAVVEDNDIDGSCGTDDATGVYSEDSWATLENNRVTAGYCDPGDDFQAAALWVLTTDSGNELVAHSNVFDAGVAGRNCESYGVLLEVDGDDPPTGPVGVFRNNAMLPGNCQSAKVSFRERSHQADPRIFENNNLDPRNSGVLYRDEGGTDVTDIGDVNTMLMQNPVVGGNISDDCGYVRYSGGFPRDFHLAHDNSPCRDTGTSAGAPAGDMDPDDLRDDGSPDIGADEYVP